ncbi:MULTISPECIES: hypothetical protein [unclassified Streptomyces]|uniref:hypothetical protein n=1 Tax=unclassified Streptomyces TaxID=2593676 RepID=UPI002E22AEA8|nr:hypothetical protein OG217_15150 [Streptomyces sp. NBC_01023]
MGGTTVRRGRVTAVAAVALAALAGCSAGGGGTGGGTGTGSGTGGSPAPGRTTADSSVTALRAVDRSTGRARSARVEGTTVLGPEMSTRVKGTVAWGDGVTGALDITYTGGTLAGALRQAGADSTIRARYRRDAYYADMGRRFAARTGGKRWIRYGYADLSRLMGASGAAMRDQMQKTAPDQGVKALLASGDVKRAGHTEIRGVPVTHYSGTVDAAALTERDSALTAAGLKAFRAQLTAAGISTETVDIWVDRNDLLVKKTERGRLRTGTYSATVYYSGYGTAVRADEPPAGDTVDFTQLVKTPPSTPAPGA